MILMSAIQVPRDMPQMFNHTRTKSNQEVTRYSPLKKKGEHMCAMLTPSLIECFLRIMKVNFVTTLELSQL